MYAMHQGSTAMPETASVEHSLTTVVHTGKQCWPAQVGTYACIVFIMDMMALEDKGIRYLSLIETLRILQTTTTNFS